VLALEGEMFLNRGSVSLKTNTKISITKVMDIKATVLITFSAIQSSNRNCFFRIEEANPLVCSDTALFCIFLLFFTNGPYQRNHYFTGK
jgi:hypothetical protein